MTTATTPKGSERIMIDSSGWLEYLTDDINAHRFAPYLENQFTVLVPTIVIYEVYKKLLPAGRRTLLHRKHFKGLNGVVFIP